MNGQKVLFSKKSDDWETPKELLEQITLEFGSLYDPCPLNAVNDGLTLSWSTKNFINPPYSKIREFVSKGFEEMFIVNHAILNVWLLPSRTDTKWFHRFFYQKHGVEIRFSRGRLKFGGSKNSAPFPSMLVVQRKLV